jgi:hypothetical protein
MRKKKKVFGEMVSLSARVGLLCLGNAASTLVWGLKDVLKWVVVLGWTGTVTEMGFRRGVLIWRKLGADAR